MPPVKMRARKPSKAEQLRVSIDVDLVEPNKGGRPTLFRPEMIERVKVLCESGAVDREIAQALGIAECTLYDWKHKYPEFSEAMKPGKEMADDRVERALFNRAVGYSFDSEKIFNDKDAGIVRAACVEHVPPDVNAARIWLENRRRDRWGRDVVPPPVIGPGLTVIIQQVIGGNVIEKTVTPGRVTVALPPPSR